MVAASVGPTSLAALATAPARQAVKAATGLVTKPALLARSFLRSRQDVGADASTPQKKPFPFKKRR